MHDLHFDHPPPLSPRSALRSLQAPSEDSSSGPVKPPSMTDSPFPVVAGMPPPRKSSLAVGLAEREDLGPGSHLHLPLPPQPIFEHEQFDVTASPRMSQSSMSSMRSPPPQVGIRTGSKSRLSLPRSQAHSQGYSSGQSIHSSSDSSSIASFPLMTPPDAQSYQHHTQFPLPSMHSQQQRIGAGQDRHPAQPSQIHQRTSSMQNNLEQHQLHQHLQHLHHMRQEKLRQAHMQMSNKGGEEDSPFAYTVDQAEPLPSSSSGRSFYSQPEYSEHRQRYAGHAPQQWSRHALPRHALPERNSSRPVIPGRLKPSRSVDDRQDSDGANPYLHPRQAPTRASLPNQAFAGRNSCDSHAPMAANGRILAPLRGSPAGMSHRASLPSMGMVEPPSPYRASHVSMWRTPEQHYDAEHHHHHQHDSMMYTASPQPSSPAVSTKRPRQFNGSPDEYERSWHQQQQYQPKSAAERRSNSSDRASVRSLDSGMRGKEKSSNSSSNNNNGWNGPKLSHAEVMARLKEKMLQRIAAKETANGSGSGTPSDESRGSSQYQVAQEATTRGRGESISSSVPSTPATSVVSVGSPAMEHQQPPSSETRGDDEARSQVAAAACADIEIDPLSSSSATTDGVEMDDTVVGSQPPRAMPVMGIESLLSAAAINDQ